MSCTGCASPFGVFKKEHGCKNCGYVFCKDCLPQKLPIPKYNNEKHRVCRNCYDIMTGKKKMKEQVDFSPPDAYLKRVAALEKGKDSRDPSSKSTRTAVPQNKGKSYPPGMAKEDIAIAERLERLKEERKKGEPPIPSQKEMEQKLAKIKKDENAPPPPSQQEMAERLAKLKGQDPSTANKPHVFQTDKRSQQQQIDDLLMEIAEEVDIDSHGINPAMDVQGRLDKLYGNEGPSNQAPSSDIKGASGPAVPLVNKEYHPITGAEEVNWQEMNALIQQVSSEMEIDAQRAIESLKKDDMLLKRLQELKTKDDKKTNDDGEPVVSGNKIVHLEEDDSSDEENEEEATKRLIQQILEEQKLDEAAATGVEASEKPTMDNMKRKNTNSSGLPDNNIPTPLTKENLGFDPDELPWCCICNNDASLRCQGCDGDLYCNRCFSIKISQVVPEIWSLCERECENYTEKAIYRGNYADVDMLHYKGNWC